MDFDDRTAIWRPLQLTSMSQITRCPSCTTTFKVVPDQLRISEGWVRCGQCKTVFDASEHLLSLDKLAPTQALPNQVVTSPQAIANSQVTASSGISNSTFSSLVQLDGASPQSQRMSEQEGGKKMVPQRSDIDNDVVIPSFLMSTDLAEKPKKRNNASVSPSAASPAISRHKPIGPFSWNKPTITPDSGVTGHSEKAALDVQPAGVISASALLSVNDDASKLASVKQIDSLKNLDSTKDVGVTPSLAPQSPLSSRKSTPFFGAPLKAPLKDQQPILAPASGGDIPFPILHVAEEDGTKAKFSPPASVASLPISPHLESSPASPRSPPVLNRQKLLLQKEDRQLGEEVTSLDEPISADESSTPSIVVTTTASEKQHAPSSSRDEALPPLVFPESTPEIKTHSGMSVPYLARGDQGVRDRIESHHAQLSGEVSFVLAARRREFWRKPWVRGSLSLGFLVLLALLVVQVGIRYRNELAAQTPQARALLLQICPFLQCELAPVRHIDDLVIDSSAFNKARGDGYLLGLTIKNRSAISLAMPAVEVTLTDNQDQPIVRRVLYPHDMGAPIEILGMGEWNATLPVSVSVSASSARISGYRLSIFYP